MQEFKKIMQATAEDSFDMETSVTYVPRHCHWNGQEYSTHSRDVSAVFHQAEVIEHMKRAEAIRECMRS